MEGEIRRCTESEEAIIVRMGEYREKSLKLEKEIEELKKSQIGDCAGCAHWKLSDNEGWGVCGKDQSNAEIGTVGFNFGCVHWEKHE